MTNKLLGNNAAERIARRTNFSMTTLEIKVLHATQEKKKTKAERQRNKTAVSSLN
jgi:hypothetical protein